MKLSLFLTAMVMTIVLITILRPIALKLGLTDHPSHRKQHSRVTPVIGGLAGYMTMLVMLSTMGEHFSNPYAYILASTLLVCVGLIDDYKELGVKARIAVQILAVLVMTEMAGIKITELGDFFGFGRVQLGGMSTLFTVFAVVGGINAFNMIDGIDGLAGGLTLVSALALAIIVWFLQDQPLFNFCLLFIAVNIGFLLFNLRIFGRPQAEIFLGDTGSTLYGFTVCWLAIYPTQGDHKLISPALVLWIIAVPLIDSVSTMLRRTLKGRSPFMADRGHIHHILTLSGYSVDRTVATLCGISLGASVIGILLDLFLRVGNTVLFLCFLVFFVSYYWSMNNAWKMMKISRYLRSRSNLHERGADRRRADRRANATIFVAAERRSTVRATLHERRSTARVTLHERSTERRKRYRRLETITVVLERRSADRRKRDRRILIDRRAVADRRYIPSSEELLEIIRRKRILEAHHLIHHILAERTQPTDKH
jgi:UDP-GlcNAc:undecaprenyl-phosphate/decaprenyl-phosphate GlcNAc-1-phosphate transferase